MLTIHNFQSLWNTLLKLILMNSLIMQLAKIFFIQNVNFYCVTLFERGTYYCPLSDRLSVCLSQSKVSLIMLTMTSDKRNASVWRPSVCRPIYF